MTVTDNAITAENVRWAYRLLLDREPESEGVLEQTFATMDALRKAFLRSEEFALRNLDLAPRSPGWVILESRWHHRLLAYLRRTIQLRKHRQAARYRCRYFTPEGANRRPPNRTGELSVGVLRHENTMRNRAVTTDDVRWAYRLLLGREPESEGVLGRPFPTMGMLRREFITSEEFTLRNPDLAPRFPGWIMVETRFGFLLWVSVDEIAISRAIMRGVYETNEVTFVKSLVRRGDRVMDIGGNIGFYTMLFATLVSPSGKVVAFEPIPYLADALTNSLTENHFESVVEFRRAALSDTEGESLMLHAPRTANFGGAHLVEEGTIPADHVHERVMTQRLDSFVGDQRLSFIKIDVEGAEPRVMRGGSTLLARDRPTILAELHNTQLRAVSNCTATDFIEQMTAERYRCLALKNGRPAQPLREYDGLQPINVVFVPI